MSFRRSSFYGQPATPRHSRRRARAPHAAGCRARVALVRRDKVERGACVLPRECDAHASGGRGDAVP